MVHDKPFDLEETMKSNDGSKWICAMEKKLESLKKNKAWNLIPPPRRQAIGCKWLSKVKDDARYKAGLIAKEFS